MKNINKWLQKDFSKGQDNSVSTNSIPPNALTRLLNMLPNKSGKALSLRPGFQEFYIDDNRATFQHAPIVALDRASVFGVKSSDLTHPSMYQAKIIAYDNPSVVSGKTVAVQALVVSDYAIQSPQSEYVSNEVTWSNDYTTPDDPGIGDTNPVLPTTYLNPFNLNPKYVPDMLDSGVYSIEYLVDDVWSDEDAGQDGYILGHDGLNNNSYWGGLGYSDIEWITAPNPECSESTDSNYWQYFWYSIDGNNMIGDLWYGENQAAFWKPIDYETSNRMVINHPYYEKNIDIGMPYKNPMIKEPHIDFTPSYDSGGIKNRKVEMLFSYDSAHYGVEAYVYYRNPLIADKTWIACNTKSSVLTPILLASQTQNIPEPTNRWETETDINGNTVVKCGFYSAIDKPEFRIIFTPSSLFKTKEDAGGYFNGMRLV